MTSSQHVFVSYRSLERSFAIFLAAELRLAGIKVWVDALPGGIGLGEHWPQSIEEALSTSRAMIVVLSPEYVRSKICRRELDRASRLGIPIFPLLLSQVSAQEVPLQLESKQYVDFTHWSESNLLHQQVQRLIDAISGDLDGIVGQQPDLEQRYLLNLIGRLESQRGVRDYVELGSTLSEVDAQIELDNDLPAIDVWGLEPEFALLSQDSLPRALLASDEETPVESLSELIATKDRFVLLGPPGAGKTTTLRSLALRLARDRLEVGEPKRLPVVVSLAGRHENESVLDLVRRNWCFDTDLDHALKDGNVVLLLDGLNEMGKGAAGRLAELKSRLESGRGPRFIIATCRSDDYLGELDLGIAKVRLKPMDSRRVDRFAEAYLENNASEFLKELREAPSIGRGLETLAQNPYFLMGLIVIYHSGRVDADSRLPRNQGMLLQSLFKVLWAREEARRTTDAIQLANLEAGLTNLAHEMIAKSLGTAVENQQAALMLGDAQLLDVSIRAGLLRRENESVQFSHQLFQEYFAARKIMGSPIEEYLSECRFRGHRISSQSRIAQPWDESLIALAGISADPSQVIDEIASIDPYLAVKCIESGIDATPSVNSALCAALLRPLSDVEEVHSLMGLHETIDHIHNADIGRALGVSNPDELVELLVQWLGRRTASISAFASLGGSTLSLLHNALEESKETSPACTTLILNALDAVGHATSMHHILPFLSHSNGKVRFAAAWALGGIGSQEAVDALVTTLSDHSSSAPRAAARSLGMIGDPTAVQALLKVVSSTKDTILLDSAANSLQILGATAELEASCRKRLSCKKIQKTSSLHSTLKKIIAQSKGSGESR